MTRVATLTIGLGLAFLGTAGLVPVLHERWPEESPHLAIQNARGYILGLVPNNLIVALMHLGWGGLGLTAGWRRVRLRAYSYTTAAVFGAMAILGAIPVTQTLFGIAPLYGFNLWLHLGIAVASAYVALELPQRRSDLSRRSESLTEPIVAKSSLALAGRPVHKVLTPYPIAFLSGVLVIDVAYWWTTLPWYNGYESLLPQASLWLLSAGFGLGCLAALAGFVDYRGSQAVKTTRHAVRHGWCSIALLIAAGLNLTVRVSDPAPLILPWGLALSGIAALLVGCSVWQGMSVTYYSRIGTRPIGPPGAERPTDPSDADEAQPHS